MGTIHGDTGFAVRRHGEVAYFAGIKGAGQVLWHPAMRFFDGGPESLQALPELIGSHLEPGDGKDGNYGFTAVDFDTRTIVESDGYGLSLRMSAEFVAYSLEGDPYITPPADVFLRYIAEGRLGWTEDSRDRTPRPLNELGMMDAAGLLERYWTLRRECDFRRTGYVWLKRPEGWRWEVLPPSVKGSRTRQEVRARIVELGIPLPEWSMDEGAEG